MIQISYLYHKARMIQRVRARARIRVRVPRTGKKTLLISFCMMLRRLMAMIFLCYIMSIIAINCINSIIEMKPSIYEVSDSNIEFRVIEQPV